MQTFMMIFQGDSKDILKQFQDDSIDLIFTSPPYADRRKQTYGGVKPEEYVEWFCLFPLNTFKVESNKYLT